MKLTNLLFTILFSVLIFTQCNPEEELNNGLDGEYIGTLTYEKERIDIKNFNSAPDTIHYFNDGVIENFTLKIQGQSYWTVVTFGEIIIQNDSLSFNLTEDYCPSNIDCAYDLDWSTVKYELEGNLLRLFFEQDWSEWQYNSSDKHITRSTKTYDLTKN